MCVTARWSPVPGHLDGQSSLTPVWPECPGHMRSPASWPGCVGGAPAVVLRHSLWLCSQFCQPGPWGVGLSVVVALGRPSVTRIPGTAGFLGAGVSRGPQAAPDGVETTGPAATSQERPPR